MTKYISIFTFVFCLAACSSNENNNTSASNSSPKKEVAPPKVIDGKKIFRQYCVTCHGVNGAMGANGAHDLTVSSLSLEERIAVITNGRNTMTPFKGLLSDKKIAAVAKYTLQLKEE